MAARDILIAGFLEWFVAIIDGGIR